MENSKQPIHPIEGSHQGIHPLAVIGLTKREYFAGLAMQGLLNHYLSEHVTGWDNKTYAI